LKQTNQVIHEEQKEPTILQIGFWEANKIPTIMGSGSGVGIATVGLPQVIKRRFKGLHQITELKTVACGGVICGDDSVGFGFP